MSRSPEEIAHEFLNKLKLWNSVPLEDIHETVSRANSDRKALTDLILAERREKEAVEHNLEAEIKLSSHYRGLHESVAMKFLILEKRSRLMEKVVESARKIYNGKKFGWGHAVRDEDWRDLDDALKALDTTEGKG